MKVALGKLAREGIEDLRGTDLVGGVEAALSYYLDVLSSDRAPDLPRDFRAGSLASDSTEVELQIDPSLGAALERYAKRQAATVADLTTHAILVYLAAWDWIEGEIRSSRGE